MIKRLKLSDHFYLDEFVPERAYNTFGSRAKYLFDPRLVDVAQLIRDITDAPYYINTWWQGGHLKYRGWRPPYLRIGSPKSAHKFGLAEDGHSDRYDSSEIYDLVMHHNDEFMALGVTRIEHHSATPGWTHLDLLPKPGLKRIHSFMP